MSGINLTLDYQDHVAVINLWFIREKKANSRFTSTKFWSLCDRVVRVTRMYGVNEPFLNFSLSKKNTVYLKRKHVFGLS